MRNMLNYAEAADYLRKSKATIRRYIKQGLLTPYVINEQTKLISTDELEKFLLSTRRRLTPSEDQTE